jgi:uncharacterized metal-binding protein
VLTELGIEKNKNFTLSKEDILRVKEAVIAACKEKNSEAEATKFSNVVGCCG